MANWIISYTGSKLKVQFSQHTPKRAAVQLHSVLNMALDGSKLLALLPGRFTTVQKHGYRCYFLRYNGMETSLKIRTHGWF